MSVMAKIKGLKSLMAHLDVKNERTPASSCIAKTSSRLNKGPCFKTQTVDKAVMTEIQAIKFMVDKKLTLSANLAKMDLLEDKECPETTNI